MTYLSHVYCIRPGKPGSTATGRGVLSLSGLSHGVVRVDKEGSLTSLTLQDCGTVLPGGINLFDVLLSHKHSFGILKGGSGVF